MDNWPELAVLIQEDCQFGLSEPCLFWPDGGSPFEIRVIFSEAFEQVSLEDGVPTSTVRPVMAVHLADFPQPPLQGDGCVITRNGSPAAFTVVDIQPDGEGDANLVLHKV